MIRKYHTAMMYRLIRLGITGSAFGFVYLLTGGPFFQLAFEISQARKGRHE